MDRKNEHIVYHVNEEKRTVVAVLTVPQHEVCAEICNIINKRANAFFTIPGIQCTPKMLLKGTYVGKAKAHPEDEWNVEEGKKWARLRARELYVKDRLRIVEGLEDVFDDIEENVESSVEFTEGVLEKIENDRKALYGKSEKDD